MTNPNIFDKILPGLYLGQRESENSYHKFDLVINLDFPFNGTDKKSLIVSGKNFKPKIIRIGLLDGRIDKKLMRKLFDFISDEINSFLKKGKLVLCHCYAGRSRSCSFLIAYLIKYRKLSFEEAYDLVKQKRPCVSPNKYFVRNLKDYDDYLCKKERKMK